METWLWRYEYDHLNPWCSGDTGLLREMIRLTRLGSFLCNHLSKRITGFLITRKRSTVSTDRKELAQLHCSRESNSSSSLTSKNRGSLTVLNMNRQMYHDPNSIFRKRHKWSYDELRWITQVSLLIEKLQGYTRSLFIKNIYNPINLRTGTSIAEEAVLFLQFGFRNLWIYLDLLLVIRMNEFMNSS